LPRHLRWRVLALLVAAAGVATPAGVALPAKHRYGATGCQPQL